MLASADDVYLLARSLVDMTIMVTEMLNEFSRHGLVLQTAKSQWTASSLVAGSVLKVCGVNLHRSDKLVCLGSLIPPDGNEKPLIEHRIDCAMKKSLN